LDQAIDALSAARKIDANSADVEYLQARVYRRRGELNRMKEHLIQAHRLGFDTDLLQKEQWLAAAQSGQMSLAEPHLDELLLDPRMDGADVCEAFVNGYLRNYNPSKALPLLEAWGKDYPDDERPHFVLGSYYQELGDYPKSETHYLKALERSPESLEIRSALASSLILQQKFKEAEQRLRQNLEQAPDHIQSRLDWADFLWQKGNSQQSFEVYQELEQRILDHESVRWGIARWLVQEKQYEEALKSLEPLIEQSPYEEEYRRALARSYQGMGRVEDAKQQFEWVAESTEQRLRIKPLKKKLRETPQNPDLRYELGRIYLHYEAPELGVQLLIGALDLDPDHTEARQELYQYFRDRGMMNMAEQFRSTD